MSPLLEMVAEYVKYNGVSALLVFDKDRSKNIPIHFCLKSLVFLHALRTVNRGGFL